MDIRTKINQAFDWYFKSLKNEKVFMGDFLEDELRHFKHNQDRYRTAIYSFNKLLAKKDGEILDIGSSPLTIIFKKIYPQSKIISLDLTSKFKERLNCYKIQFFRVDLNKESLSKINKKFDVIFFLEVIEHLEEKNHGLILKELEKILKPGGFCIVQTPNRNSLRTKFFKFQTQFSLKPGEIHLKEYTQDEFMTLIREKTNFEVVEANYYLYYDYPSSTIVYRKIKPLAFPLLIVNLLIVAIFPPLRRGMQFILKKDE